MKHLVHPYVDLQAGRWLRGNLHTHTTRSDGKRDPQAVIDDYRERGYGFLMISDHDIYSGPSEYAQWDSGDMILIPGNEVSKNGPHLLHVDGNSLVTPHEDRQRVMDEAVRDGGFVVVNHPNWGVDFTHCTIDQMRTWQGYVGMEIYNGTIGRLKGSPYATDKWDMLLTDGRRLWGFANDDSHLEKSDVGLGWNMAYVQGNTADDVVEALSRGRCYASTGVTIRDIRVDGMTIRVETEDAQRVVAIKQGAVRVAQADGPTLEVEVPEDAQYVRFECWGQGESFAWTQPFFVED